MQGRVIASGRKGSRVRLFSKHGLCIVISGEVKGTYKSLVRSGIKV